MAEAVEADPWGRGYKTVTKRIGGKPPGAETVGRELAIVSGLFPALLRLGVDISVG